MHVVGVMKGGTVLIEANLWEIRNICTVKAVRKLIGRGELSALKLSPRRTRVLKADAEKYVLEKLARKG